MFKLSDILAYDTIKIQCHDNPDADTVSCAFAVQTYLKDCGKDAKIYYSGAQQITKCNLLTIIERFDIEIEHIRIPDKSDIPDLLITADCQYGEGNVTKFPARNVAVIDHHPQVVDTVGIGVIKPELSACATVVWELLRLENFDFQRHKDVATALYYGLYSDTVGLTEISHPLDMDMRDTLVYDKELLRILRFSNFTFEELEIAGVALLRNSKDKSKRYALFKAEHCDQNLLGVIADLGLQVNTVDMCVVYAQNESLARLSVRSCTRRVMASEYVEFLTNGVGTGGGRKDKAGGFIKKSLIDEMGITVYEYIDQKTTEYFNSFDIITAGEQTIDTAGMKIYKRRPVPRGYVISSDIFEPGTPVLVRAIKSDSNITASPDMYLIIGTQGEVYPSTAEKFAASYIIPDGRREPLETRFKYSPTAKNKLTGEIKELLPYMKTCVPSGKRRVYAAPLERNTKVFTELDAEGYIYGRTGDRLAVNLDDERDIYIVPKEVFDITYEACE